MGLTARSLTNNRSTSQKTAGRGWLQWINLRQEESDRTLWMFAFYTVTSVGVLWLEVTSSALFLGEYGSSRLPWIYIVSAGIGTGLGFFYSFLQRLLPLRQAIVVIAVFMALPLVMFRFGLAGSPVMVGYTVFLMRLWLEAIYVLNELNTSITANQLFNIREIKRTYPLISSGILAADVLSGLSLPPLRSLVGIQNVVLLASLMLFLGAVILFHISQTYSQFFPDSTRRPPSDDQQDYTSRRLRGPIQSYVFLLITFFVMAQVLLLLVDLVYLAQLEQKLDMNGSVDQIADFLALFSAILGFFELLLQWFVSSRVIERLGVFVVTITPPALILLLSLLSMVGVVNLFWGLIVLKFLDELLRYTVLASTGAVLFQPIPENIRGYVQSWTRGIAEPISIGLTGVGMLAILWFCSVMFTGSNLAEMQSRVFLLIIVLASAVWMLTVWLLRSRYLNLLVVSAGRGDLSLSDVDVRAMKRSISEALSRGREADKKSCIELLTHLDPKSAGEVLAPLLPVLPPTLQRQSLTAMSEYPNPAYLGQVRGLLQSPQPASVLASAMRYLWLTDPNPDIEQLRPYLEPEMDAEVRGTAAALMLRRGNLEQRVKATDILKRMLTHERERERVMGCRALGEANHLQALRLHVEPLLQDESLRVRCALLEAIAATHTEEYYPSLLRGLYYKSTREAAMQALVRLGDDAIPMLVDLGQDIYKSELVRTYAWNSIGRIGSLEAVNALVTHLMTSWGTSRRTILKTLLKVPHEEGIEAVADMLGRSGVEELIYQELMFQGQILGSLMDLPKEAVVYVEADLLRRSLRDLLSDSQERIFLLLRFLYPSNTIQAAAFNLQSDSWDNTARGLEILDNTVDLQVKRILLTVFDHHPDAEKLECLSELVVYQPLPPSQRVRYLLELRHFLSEWTLACCFHLARQARWSLTPDQAIACLRHPTSFVREAVLLYLSVASPRSLRELLPVLEKDPDPVMAAQVEHITEALGLKSSGPFGKLNRKPPSSFSGASQSNES
jgi:HEAT repeat protein